MNTLQKSAMMVLVAVVLLLVAVVSGQASSRRDGCADYIWHNQQYAEFVKVKYPKAGRVACVYEFKTAPEGIATPTAYPTVPPMPIEPTATGFVPNPPSEVQP